MASEISSSPSKEAVLSKATLNAAKYLGLSLSELAQLLEISELSVSRLAASTRFIDPCGDEGERALMLIRIFSALDALVGGDMDASVTWMNAHNNAIGNLPRHAIQTLSGLERTMVYLNNLVAVTATGQVCRPQ